MKTHSLLVVAISLGSMTGIQAQAERHTDDHLVPLKASVYDDLRPALYRKLCVTEANYGRMIELPPGTEQTEWAVSIHCAEGAQSSDLCSVTLTRAASNLDYIMQQNRGKNPLTIVNTVKVVRKDAPIKKATASVVRAAWMRFLRDSKASPNRPNDPIALDASKIEFWLVPLRGKAMKAEAPDNPGKSVTTLVNIGRLLAKYCEAPVSDRELLQKKIETDSQTLVGSAKGNR